MAEEYQYKNGYFGPRDIPASVVAAELARLHENGRVTAEDFVEAAKPKSSPIHEVLEWNDKVAGHEYRLIQARTVIRAVVRVRSDGPKRLPPQTLMVHVPDRSINKSGYYTYQDERLVENSDEYALALTELKRKLDSAESSFHELRRLSEGRGDKSEALAIAIQGFNAVQQALTLLKAA